MSATITTTTTNGLSAPAPEPPINDAHNYPRPANPKRIAYLFGTPIDHSLSPLMHQTVYNALGLPWTQLRFSSSDVPLFMQTTRNDPRFYGSAVTMPNKVAIMSELDEVTEEARDVGACNTIFVREEEGKGRVFVGTNTDVAGISESFYQNVPDASTRFPNTPGLVIGGGGAARSAVYALHRHLHCSPIYIVNRDATEVSAVITHCTAHGYGTNLIHLSSIPQAQSLAPPTAIVSCIPDIQPRTEQEVEVRGIIAEVLGKESKGVMLEMAYHPRPHTTLAGIAESLGWQVVLGTEAMIYQGLEQDRLWTGRKLEELPVEEVKAVIAKHL